MTTFSDLSKQLASRVRKALAQDGLTKTTTINVSSLIGSNVVQELKDIDRELEQYADSDRKKIANGAGEELELERPEDFLDIAKNSSNDAYLELVEHISEILRKMSRRVIF